MGLTTAFLILPAPAVAGSTSDSGRGWMRADAPYGQPADAVAREAVKRLGCPALAGWIYDSDFGRLAGAAPRGSEVEIVVGDAYDPATGDSLDPFAAELALTGDPVAWCDEAGTYFSAPKLDEAREMDATFCEERLSVVFEALGLPPELVRQL